MSGKSKSFCIAHDTNPTTGEVFGDKYGEPVIVRRPTSTDKVHISVRHNGALGAYGARPEDIPEAIANINYIFCFLDTLCDADSRPDWTKRENVFDEDEPAMFHLFQEVSLWLDTFRPKRTKPEG